MCVIYLNQIIVNPDYEKPTTNIDAKYWKSQTETLQFMYSVSGR